MPTSNIIKVAIISDLHAVQCNKDEHKNTFLTTAIPEVDCQKHPISGLCKLIKNENLTADLVICCGDLGDQADPGGIRYGWKQVKRVQRELKASVLTTTSGNHDVDSRSKYNSDPWYTLKNLQPPFPSPKQALKNSFWSNYWFSNNHNGVRIVNLNSSAFHSNKFQSKHGFVTEELIAQLRERLESEAPGLINILVCHHHPQRHMELRLGAHDDMVNGQLLLDLLGNSKYGDWLVVHGHKHHPKITYASGGANSPVVFSAGSVSAKIFPDLGVRNQFHIIEFPIKRISELGLVGTFRTWEWTYNRPWDAARTGSGLPFIGGFGIREYRLLASRIKKVASRRSFISWQEVERKLPEVNYLLPRDLKSLLDVLKSDHALNSFLNEFGMPRQIGK